MVKKILSTAIAMIAISSAANASVLLSSDNAQQSMAEHACYPDWTKGTPTMDMALKSLEQTKEFGVWRNDMMPLKQSHNNEMADASPSEIWEMYLKHIHSLSDFLRTKPKYNDFKRL